MYVYIYIYMCGLIQNTGSAYIKRKGNRIRSCVYLYIYTTVFGKTEILCALLY